MIKSTGITRKVDELGRIVIPMELRNKLGIAEKDPLEIFVDGSSIILKKYNPNCIFCGNSKDLLTFNDNLICTKCQSKIKELTITKKEDSPKETASENQTQVQPASQTQPQNQTEQNNAAPASASSETNTSTSSVRPSTGFDYSKYFRHS